MKSFEPHIILFACKSCYQAADAAGESRFQYPTNIEIIKLMCTGRVTPTFIFKSFDSGADGVLIAGCPPGHCNFSSGNLQCQKVVEKSKQIMELLGLYTERLATKWFSANEGLKFSQAMTKFTEKIKKIGPSPLKRN
jgi:F420-non-reducing hydrogenase iron-sulfur subunit